MHSALPREIQSPRTAQRRLIGQKPLISARNDGKRGGTAAIIAGREGRDHRSQSHTSRFSKTWPSFFASRRSPVRDRLAPWAGCGLWRGIADGSVRSPRQVPYAFRSDFCPFLPKDGTELSSPPVSSSAASNVMLLVIDTSRARGAGCPIAGRLQRPRPRPQRVASARGS